MRVLYEYWLPVNFTRTSSFCAGLVFRQLVVSYNKMAAVKIGNDDKEELISCVQQFPALYDKTCIQHRNRKFADDSSKAIAELFDNYGESIAVVNFR